MKTISSSILATFVLTSLVGCGSTLPPKELVDARAAYQNAAKGPAAAQNPAELHVAKQALEQAERSFDDDGDSAQTKDFSYIAIRKAQLADASANAILAQKEKLAAEREAQNVRDEQLSKTQSELDKARRSHADSEANLTRTREQLEQEKKLREEAEKRYAAALVDLQKIASVKQETRGMVITLSGEVLFTSGQATLTPGAILKLNDVAKALTESNPDSTITVEGHTDSQGARDFNMNLAQKRADAVREHLVSKGVAADRIKAIGIGPDRPIADNKTAEGRANNRRVEIVVQPPAKK